MTCNIIWQGNPISVVKTVATKNCALCAKERIAVLKQSRSNAQFLINSNNGACRHRPHFHMYVKQTTPGTDESIHDERASPTREVPTDLTRCNVCLANWKHCEDPPPKKNNFLFISRALALETIPIIYYKSVTHCCLV